MPSQLELSHFIDLFSGHKDFYGVHIYKKTNENEKEKGQSFTKDLPLSNKNYQDHLLGKQGLGIIPIDNNNNVRFMVFDVDDIGIDIQPFLKINNEYELPFNFFRSKSGGLHIYVFFNESIKAQKGLLYMKKFLYIFGLKKDTEIFPKQERLLKNQKGNWINLPYYNSDDTKQYLYDEQGKQLTLTEAMLKLTKRKITFNQFKESYDMLPYNDAPICVQSCLIHKNISNRNMLLFDAVTYFKAKGDDYEEKIIEVNKNLHNPLSEKELHTTVINSQRKKSYSYRCKESPMVDYCNKDFCLKREFGFGGDNVSKLSFENLVQIKADTPYYKWTVNGVIMTFFSEQELRDQSKFADYCMRELHIVPNKLKITSWYKILENAFKEITVEEIDPEDDISPGALFFSYLQEFLLNRAYAKSREQILMNRVFKNDDLTEFIFKKEALIKFFYEIKNFRYFSTTEIQDRLKRLNAMPKRFYINKKQTVRVWSIPFEMFKNKILNKGEQKIDFSGYKEKEEF